MCASKKRTSRETKSVKLGFQKAVALLCSTLMSAEDVKILCGFIAKEEKIDVYFGDGFSVEAFRLTTHARNIKDIRGTLRKARREGNPYTQEMRRNFLKMAMAHRLSMRSSDLVPQTQASAEDARRRICSVACNERVAACN